MNSRPARRLAGRSGNKSAHMNTISTLSTADLTKALQAADININWSNAEDAQATLGLPRAMVKILEA